MGGMLVLVIVGDEVGLEIGVQSDVGDVGQGEGRVWWGWVGTSLLAAPVLKIDRNPSFLPVPPQRFFGPLSASAPAANFGQ